MNYNDEDTKIFELIEQKEEEKEQKQQETKGSKEKNKKDKINLKDRWNKFTKKQKILIISLSCLIIIFLVIGIIFLVKGNEKLETEVPEDPKIVIENKNYRYEDGNLILLDKNDQELGTYKCKNKDAEKCYVAYNSNEDELDETKYIYPTGEPVSTQTPIINDTYVFIYDNNTKTDTVTILYNIKENKEEETYRLVKKAINNDSYFIVADTEGNYGLIGITENGIAQIIKFKYEYLAVADKSIQELSCFIAKINDKYVIIDKDENVLSKPIKEAIVGYNDKYIKAVGEGGIKKVYDYQGNKILENECEYIYLVDQYIGIVKDRLLYMIDEKENYLNVDGIELINDNYDKSYIYDENDKLTEISHAADISISDNNIVITIFGEEDETVHTINILEATINNKLDYVSYIDGKLYFYSDEEKKNLIGSYSCKNKNTITDENSSLQNCYVAKESSYSDNEINSKTESLGYLPIINNRYVFINDVLDAKKQSIILYDLVDKKTKSTYLSVDAGIYSNNSSLSFYDTDSLNVIAVSAKKNKYGMITISKNDVTSFREFSNNKIERIGGYYLVNKASGTYCLIDANNNEVTKEYSYKIVKYYKNYVKVLDNNKYLVYDFNENKITDKAYEYIALYDDNIAVIDNNKLSVIKYDKTILVSDIELKISDYNNAYSIDSQSVTIYNDDQTFEKIPFVKEDNVIENGENTNGEE